MAHGNVSRSVRMCSGREGHRTVATVAPGADTKLIFFPKYHFTLLERRHNFVRIHHNRRYKTHTRKT